MGNDKIKGSIPLEPAMGDSKRRKDMPDSTYGKDQPIVPWLPVTKTQADQFVKITTTGAWAGIGALVLVWIGIRFVGPMMGWWEVN
jgi:Protein of unknown function (DUF2839)